jgi:LPXTG-site transpeptidase (sortase) family protein
MGRPRALIGLVAAALTVGLVASPAVAGSAEAKAKATPTASRQTATHSSQSNGALVGSLRIPAINLQEPVRSGVAPKIINAGVAHWVGTARPGGTGNVVLAGHRTTHTRPFFDLDKLVPGDLIYMMNGQGFDVIYRVRETFIVTPEDIWITYDQGQPMLTMFACHPKGSKRYRIVVQAELVGNRPIA